jgi:ornithine cyclodeaminase/alanine dehydrogenase-like protein (mu-crystallin family)
VGAGLNGKANLLRVIDGSQVREHLTYERCIPLVREAMIRFSAGQTQQLLRSILDLGEGRMFGVMPGGMGEGGVFGAKLVSVFPSDGSAGHRSHQGVVVLFDGVTGAPVCVVDAAEITAIRTACASAVATDALARPDAKVLAILGTGEQAQHHALAIAKVRPLDAIRIWGRSAERAVALARRIAAETGVATEACVSVEAAVDQADIICTVTSAREPILMGRWVAAGTHVNVVGSSHAGPVEIDNDLVAASRFIADSREGVLKQGAEFLAAKAAGVIGDDHLVGEIGQVLAGDLQGRQSPDQITLYKSLGHVVQDLAAASLLNDIP